MADIVLINPLFAVSFWGFENALPLLGKKAGMPPASLPLLAALTPAGHQVTLIDENIEAIDYDRCARADIVGITGMSVQRFRMREILAELKLRDVFTVVGGPWITVREDYFGDLADVVFIGEAEETWPRFLDEWQRGEQRSRYEQTAKTDMTRLPVPRFDLLKMHQYATGSVQFSRGCPFTCEFCDIIVIFGRRPRVKSSAQIVAELEVLRASGLRTVFIVDDNLIGNRKLIKEVLRDVIAWQEVNGYPLAFSTEASLDLAEDQELMQLMVESGIYAVFVGIESPNEASLRETKKLQNVRKGNTMVERVHTIQRAGMEVYSGMILGFDHDEPSIFEAQRRFLEEARIANAMIGMLTAIPKTPLHARLMREQRLDPADDFAYGTNVIPREMSRRELRDGYIDLMRHVYAPDAYFTRLESLFIEGRLTTSRGRARYWGQHPWHGLCAKVQFLAQAAGLYARLMWGVGEVALRREYSFRLWRLLKARREPGVLYVYTLRCAWHYHFYLLTQQLAGGRSAIVNSF